MKKLWINLGLVAMLGGFTFGCQESTPTDVSKENKTGMEGDTTNTVVIEEEEVITEMPEAKADSFMTAVEGFMTEHDIAIPEGGLKMETTLTELNMNEEQLTHFKEMIGDKCEVTSEKIEEHWPEMSTLGDVFTHLKTEGDGEEHGHDH